MKTSRLEAFSDGVFTIAATLLVLEIKVPAGTELGPGLIHLWPSYLAYIMSFVVIGAIWINHHVIFDQIARVDQRLLLLNTFHLMFIAFLPFPTAVLAEALHARASEEIATAFYGATLLAIGICVIAMWRYASRHRELLDPSVSPAAARLMGRRLLIGPAGYAVATVIAFLMPMLSIAIFLGLNIYFLWPRDAIKGAV